MMVFAMFMLLSAQAAPTLAAIERLAPRAAGEVALAGRDHRPIVGVVARDISGPVPPGEFELEMVERPVAASGGCVRTRWTVRFQGQAGARRDARLTDAYPATELAARRTGGCPREGYAHLNGGIAQAEAMDALRRLDAIRLGKAKIAFACSDSTGSGLCGDRRGLRRALARLAPWAIKREGGETILWLGAVARRPMQPVTEVRYSATDPLRVSISRRDPAPF